MPVVVSPAASLDVLRPAGRHPLVRRAWRFVLRSLAGRVRASTGEAAIVHAERVATIVRREFGARSPETTALALLHDVLEDSNADIGTLQRAFGPRLSGDVMTLTKPVLGPKTLRRSYFLQTLQHGSDDVKLVKLADYLDNFRARTGTARERSTREGAERFLDLLARTPQNAAVSRAMARVRGELRAFNECHRDATIAASDELACVAA